MSVRRQHLPQDSEVLRYTLKTDMASDLSPTSEPILLQRGVRQGDVISPKLFTAAQEEVFKFLDWRGLWRGLRVSLRDQISNEGVSLFLI